MLFVIQLARFITRTVLVVALTAACLNSGMAQAQELTAHEPTAAENDSAAEASKQAANPLASVWLMQFQQNNSWLGMPANGGNRVQSNLQFQPLMSVKLTDDWSLVTRPVLQLFNATPSQDQAGQSNRVTGFGDTAVALALSPGHRLVGNWLLAAGPTFIFPTATDSRIGQDKWQVGQADGAFPVGNLAFDSSGNLYGAALGGGSFSGSSCSDFGCGVVYELSPGANGWTETVLYTFTGGSDGWRPNGVTFDTAGNLLGLADHGGSGYGTIFKLVSGGGGWTFNLLYAFTGGSDGAYPAYNLLLDSAGNIYGTALGGGLVNCSGSGCGTVFELSPNGSGWTFSNPYSFSGPDGEAPHGILFDPSGNILGVADGGVPNCPAAGCGVLFKLVPGSGSWTESVLFTLNGTSDGEFPNPVVMDSAGNLFGTAVGGGTYNKGTLFEFVP